MSALGTARVPHDTGRSAGESTRPRSKLVVGLSFLVAFVIALYVVTFVGSFFAGPDRTFKPLNGQEGDDVFSDALIVKGPSNAVRVEDSPKLTPLADRDFLFFIWFKLRQPLEKEERVNIMGKYDPDTKERIGYGLSLVGGLDGVRPQVYWQGEAGAGSWHTFAAAPLKPQQWYLLTVSFRERKFLGVHIASLGNESKPLVLGGFSVEGTGIPKNNADLVVGAFGTSYFQGRIGPFGIIQSNAFSDNVSAFARQLADKPLALPDTVGADEVALWASPRKDRGPAALPILNARTSREVQGRKPPR